MEGSVRLAVVQPRIIRPDESANVAEAVVYATQAADQVHRSLSFPSAIQVRMRVRPAFLPWKVCRLWRRSMGCTWDTALWKWLRGVVIPVQNVTTTSISCWGRRGQLHLGISR